MGEKVTLKTNQRRALEALAETGSVTEAAEAAGVARKTVHTWLKQPEFRQAVAEAEALALAELSRELAAGASVATGTLHEIMTDSDQPASVRVRAAMGWLSSIAPVRELLDIEARLTALESRFNDEAIKKQTSPAGDSQPGGRNSTL